MHAQNKNLIVNAELGAMKSVRNNNLSQMVSKNCAQRSSVAERCVLAMVRGLRH